MYEPETAPGRPPSPRTHTLLARGMGDLPWHTQPAGTHQRRPPLAHTHALCQHEPEKACPGTSILPAMAPSHARAHAPQADPHFGGVLGLGEPGALHLKANGCVLQVVVAEAGPLTRVCLCEGRAWVQLCTSPHSSGSWASHKRRSVGYL